MFRMWLIFNCNTDIHVYVVVAGGWRMLWNLAEDRRQRADQQVNHWQLQAFIIFKAIKV